MIYLNYAALCPARPEATRAVEATMSMFDTVLYSPAGLNWYEETMAASRRAIAGFLQVPDGSAIAFVPNATLAAHMIFSCIEWQTGEIIVTSAHENPSIMRELNRLVHRGVRLVLIDPTSPQGLLDAIEQCVKTRPVKAMLFSHVSHVDGRIFPIAEIGSLAQRHNISLFIDGAQAAGQIPVNLSQQAFDVYFFPGHKWCRGPLGTGALAIHPQFLDHHPSRAVLLRVQPLVAQFEIGTHHIGLIAGLAAACEAAQRGGTGTESISRHRSSAIRAMQNVPALRLSTWDGPHAPGIATWRYRTRRGRNSLGQHLHSRHAIVVKDFTEYPVQVCPAIRASWIEDTPRHAVSAMIEAVREAFP